MRDENEIAEQVSVASSSSGSSNLDIYKHGKELELIGDIKERYKVGKVIGKGSFGTVRQATFRQAKVECAIKIVPK